MSKYVQIHACAWCAPKMTYEYNGGGGPEHAPAAGTHIRSILRQRQYALA